MQTRKLYDLLFSKVIFFTQKKGRWEADLSAGLALSARSFGRQVLVSCLGDPDHDPMSKGCTRSHCRFPSAISGDVYAAVFGNRSIDSRLR